jgi:crossover junction endodeoxyribonuclease RuvC
MDSMRIIGIDPGIGRTGWGVIEKTSESKLMHVASGCIETAPHQDVSGRLHTIYDELCDVLVQYRADHAAVEELFFNTNVTTALSVGQARGVVLLSLSIAHIPIGIYTPLQVKQSLTGYGRAAKGQVGMMVKTLLKLPSIPTPDDRADALAIAITHAHTLR